jgi:hypothetical protein
LGKEQRVEILLVLVGVLFFRPRSAKLDVITMLLRGLLEVTTRELGRDYVWKSKYAPLITIVCTLYLLASIL